jgi:hypothetical protein
VLHNLKNILQKLTPPSRWYNVGEHLRHDYNFVNIWDNNIASGERGCNHFVDESIHDMSSNFYKLPTPLNIII